MISWMQEHKKWLVVTIWISTIAFVGAGFVGWGAYEYGSSAGKIAKVGEIEIKADEFQRKYSELYSYYNNMLQGKLDKQKAKELGLEKEALNSLVTEALLMNLARELGLTVLDDEVKNKIVSMREFSTNGKFDKKIYLETLKRVGMKPKDYETLVKKAILIQKLQEILELPLAKLEKNSFGASLFIGDKIKYTVLDSRDINVTYNETQLIEFWKKREQNYIKQPQYVLSILWYDPFEIPEPSKEELLKFFEKNRHLFKEPNGKLMDFDSAKEAVLNEYRIKKGKKEALKKYLKFKKGEIEPQETIRVSEQNEIFDGNLMKEIGQKSENFYLKPKLIGKKYAIIRLDKKVPSRPMTFEEARVRVIKDFVEAEKKSLLTKRAEALSKNFDGKVTDFISRDDVDKLKPLKETEAAEFLSVLFSVTEPSGYILLESGKAVVYQILEQKLIMKKKLEQNSAFITENTKKVKESVEWDNLLKNLQKRYEIEIYYKGL